MRCLHQACQLIGRDHRHLPLALAPNDNDFPVVANPVESGCQALPQIGISSFCHIDNRIHIVQVSCTSFQHSLFYNLYVPESATARLDRVLAQLLLYEHPLLNFSARTKGEGVEIIIQFKDPSFPVHTYHFDLHPRDLDDSQFEWSFQRQLYDALHDYFMEMFIRTPQDRLDRRTKGL